MSSIAHTRRREKRCPLKNQSSLLRGLNSGLPIALGYIPIAITYGLIAKTQGIPLWFTMALSLTTFAGSSQFIALQLLAAGGGAVEIILTTFAINFRNFLMASAVSLRGASGYTPAQKTFTGLTVTDESFAVAGSQPEKHLPFGFLLGLQGILYLAWNGGSLMGATLVGELNAIWSNSLGIAIYAMFISMVIPVVRANRVMAAVAAVTGGLSVGLSALGIQRLLGSSSVLMLSAVIGAAFGAVLLRKRGGQYD